MTVFLFLNNCLGCWDATTHTLLMNQVQSDEGADKQQTD